MKKTIFLILAMAISAFANIPQRGVNNKIEYLSASGSGTASDPYVQAVSTSGSTSITNSYQDRDFLLAVQMGKVAGHSIYQYDPEWTPVPALTDIRIEVSEVSATMGATAEFEILCVNESFFSTNYLQSIRQPGY